VYPCWLKVFRLLQSLLQLVKIVVDTQLRQFEVGCAPRGQRTEAKAKLNA